MPHHVFISGATGFMGRALSPALLERGHSVTALVRPGSEGRATKGCRVVTGDPFDAHSFAAQIPAAATFVHLVGAKSPAPWKNREFRSIDRCSAKASIAAAVEARVAHFIYLSVAHPAPMMQAYIRVRQEGEALLRASGLNATMVRPWYVLGPGRRWPLILVPFYKVFEQLPATRDGALRLGLVTIEQMAATLVSAVEHPAAGIRVLETAAIRSGSAVS